MTLKVELWQNPNKFKKLLAIKESRDDELLSETVNFLLEFAIEVYLLENNILEEI